MRSILPLVAAARSGLARLSCATNRANRDVDPELDLTWFDELIRAKAAELVTAGATALREESYGERLGHVVMLDPEDNEFCVA